MSLLKSIITLASTPVRCLGELGKDLETLMDDRKDETKGILAIDVAKDMNLGAYFISFLKCFEELKELLINGKYDESSKLLDEIYNSRKDIVRFWGVKTR